MLNEFFRSVREMQGIKQSDVAEWTHITQSSIAKYESGVSTLSKETLERIASLLSINPEYIENKSANPFKSDKLIRMFLPTKLGLKLDYSFIRSLIELNRKFDILFLTVNYAYLDKLTKATMFGNPSYAILFRDQDNNVFIFRRKEKSVFSAAITGEKGLLADIEHISEKEGKVFHHNFIEIKKELYEKIQSWDDLRKEDVEPLFKKDVIYFELGKKLDKLCQEIHVTPDVALEYIKRNSKKLQKTK